MYFCTAQAACLVTPCARVVVCLCACCVRACARVCVHVCARARAGGAAGRTLGERVEEYSAKLLLSGSGGAQQVDPHHYSDSYFAADAS